MFVFPFFPLHTPRMTMCFYWLHPLKSLLGASQQHSKVLPALKEFISIIRMESRVKRHRILSSPGFRASLAFMAHGIEQKLTEK